MFSTSWSQPLSSPPMSSSQLRLGLVNSCPLACLEALNPSLCSFQGITLLLPLAEGSGSLSLSGGKC